MFLGPAFTSKVVDPFDKFSARRVGYHNSPSSASQMPEGELPAQKVGFGGWCSTKEARTVSLFGTVTGMSEDIGVCSCCRCIRKGRFTMNTPFYQHQTLAAIHVLPVRQRSIK